MSDNSVLTPVIALRGITLFPGTVSHFDVSRPRSIQAAETAMKTDQMIFLVTQRDSDVEKPGQDDLYEIGILTEIKQVIKLQKDIVRILISGGQRARLLEISPGGGYATVDPTIAADEDDLIPAAKEAMVSSVQETFAKYVRVNGKIPQETIRQAAETDELKKLMDLIAGALPVHFSKKQELLEALKLSERYEKLLLLLFHEIEVCDIRNGLQAKVKQRVDKNQRDYLLREEMSAIREELGDDPENDADRYDKETDALDATDAVKEHLHKEIKRFRKLPLNAADNVVMRNYIETLLELPWSRKTEDAGDLRQAKEILDRDHYGLKKVKDRVLDFLAVRSLTGKGESPIICLVGPPGTGKTSIAHSVAEALNKKYIRVCLGGVHDEAEIRGHRRTYVGAMPGRIVDALRQAGCCNPLMLLDEIDKVGSDYKGDVASALLEILDGEQNSHFRDHFVETPIDLSEVLFICTANYAEDIPKPLYDRMEIIEVSSYTQNEKFHIAKEHLIAKQMKANGINPDQLAIDDEAITSIIRGYTREAGVRGLERRIGEICRKTARAVCMGEGPVHVTVDNLEDYLGKVKYIPEKINEKNEVGTVCGLAWTSVGGVTMQLEAAVIEGEGSSQVTGQLGNVMKESTQVASTCVGMKLIKEGCPRKYLDNLTLHLHVLDGATPKDGPSAGVTIATALYSAITAIPVRADVAMTGEISIRGKVMPIGGLKEKLLAANMAGIKTVCIPKENQKDLDELEPEITEGMEVITVETIDEVLKIALVPQEQNFDPIADYIARQQDANRKVDSDSQKEAITAEGHNPL